MPPQVVTAQGRRYEEALSASADNVSGIFFTLAALAKDVEISKADVGALLADFVVQRMLSLHVAPQHLVSLVLEHAVDAGNVAFLKRVWRHVSWRCWAPALDRLLCRTALSLAAMSDREYARTLCVRQLLFAVKMTQAIEPDVDLGAPAEVDPVFCVERGSYESGALMLSNIHNITWHVRNSPAVALSAQTAAALSEHFAAELARHYESTLTLSHGPLTMPAPPVDVAGALVLGRSMPENAFAPVVRALFAALDTRRVGEQAEQGDNVEVARAIFSTLSPAAARKLATSYDSCGDTPLHHVRSAEMATLLIEHGAMVNAHPRGRPAGWTPLTSACLYAHAATPALVRTLLAAGARSDAVDTDGRTPLHWAAMAHGNVRATLATLRVLREHDEAAFVRALAQRSVFGETPLHCAGTQCRNATPAEEDVLAIVRFIVDAGADVHARNAKGKTVRDLEAATSRCYPSIVALYDAQLAVPVV